MTGIYFLIRDNKVVYIGKTTKWPLRLKNHIYQEMDYERAKFLEYPLEKLDLMERLYIEKYKPEENNAFTHGPRKSKVSPKSDYLRRAIATQKFKQDHMRLRKLTEKSIIGFGKYYHTKVSAVRPLDIASLYFTCSHINFFDDVLDRAGITAEYRIEKPGCGDYIKFAQEVWPRDFDSKIQKSEWGRRDASIKKLQRIDKIQNSKSYNRAFNQK